MWSGRFGLTFDMTGRAATRANPTVARMGNDGRERPRERPNNPRHSSFVVRLSAIAFAHRPRALPSRCKISRVGRVIVVANQKGGVGKTTTVANLGAALAELGKRVVLIDLDPQGSLTAGLGFDPYSLTRTAYTLLSRDKVSFGSVLRTVNERLVLVPASVDLAHLDVEQGANSHKAFRLRTAIEGSRVPADFFIIDTPPNLGLLTANALVAARELLVPVQCTYLSMRGVRGLLEAVYRVHDRLNAELSLLGILATLYKPGSDHAYDVLEELRTTFGDRLFSTVIEEDDAAAQAPAAHQSVLAYRPQSEAAGAFRRLAEEVIGNGNP